MNKVMHTLDEVTRLIESGEPLLLAGDEAVLAQLPKGSWIGGTIPYFMAEKGGELSREKIFVTRLPDYMADVKIQVYRESSLETVYHDIPDNGVGFIIIPATSPTHLTFALNGPEYEGFGTKPLVGWISGVFLDDLGKVSPKVFSGLTGEPLENNAVVLSAALPDEKAADLNIVNIFQQGDGDEIVFLQDGFSARDALVNGEKVNFAEYVKERDLDVRLPLVADYYGAAVNISFQSVDEKTGEVAFYAPVFKDMPYRHAGAVGNYVEEFTCRLPDSSDEALIFSCNCILNYLYSELEGKETGGIMGPITFGEVAYQLLNQTLVYLTITNAG